MTGFLFNVAVFLVLLGVLVFVHELGHYWAAKSFGIWVHRFSIGMGKTIKALSFRRGETEWAISWLPLGGYVRMASREEDPATLALEGGAAPEVPADRVFEAKPVWQRMIVILAGVTFNAIFAWVVYTGLAWRNGRQFDPTTTIGVVRLNKLPSAATAAGQISPGTRVTTVDGRPVATWDDIVQFIVSGTGNDIVLGFADGKSLSLPLHRDALVERSRLADALEPMHPAVIGALSEGYPAERAGIRVGDSIVAVNGSPVSQWAEVMAPIRASPDVAITLSLVRGDSTLEIAVTPRGERDTSDSAGAMIGRVGVTPRTPYRYEPLSLIPAMREGVSLSANSATTIYRTLSGLTNGNVSHKEVGGPILIGQMAGQAARAGLEPFLALMALISINLAVVNLLPIPVLDGGAFLLLVAEGMIRRPLPQRLREGVQILGFVFVVLLMVTALWNDLVRLVTG